MPTGAEAMFTVERDGSVALIRLDNPPVNAVTFDRWRMVPDLVRGLETDPAIGVMVFTGLPHKHFCGGNDFREFQGLAPADTLRGTGAVRDAMRAVRESRLPAVASLHGAAMGSGFMLACACDVRFATPDAKLGLPEVKVGAFGGYRIVREVLGQGEARAMTFSGRPISGERAHQVGLVQGLADGAAGVLDLALGWAREVGGLLAGTLRQEIKAVLNREDEEPLWDAYERERDLAARTMGVAVGS